MANSVFANGREIACKAGAGKTIAAFPDVCFTPPENPATPPGVPVPYPNTGMASDATDGSKKVKITDKEVMLKNKSCFKKSMGDEAGAAAKKGVVTSKNTGKVYFNAWSMDVKFEGENVDRHLDLTTNNHASMPGDTPGWPYLDSIDLEKGDPCFKEVENERTACAEYKPSGRKDPCTKTSLGISGKPSGSKSSLSARNLADNVAANDCLAARRCSLKPYKSTSKKISKCCPQQTGHHLIEASSLHDSGRGGGGSTALKGVKEKYSENMAPCVCAEGKNQNTGTHGLLHAFQSAGAALITKIGNIPLSNGGKTKKVKVTTYGDAKTNAVEGMRKTFPRSKCRPECTKAQLDNYHKMDDKTKIKAVETGGIDKGTAKTRVKDRKTRLAGRR